ncbi:SMI1/KNR4 family protein [Amycolatopsis magusensis]|uniref:SMI1/KNR4 family protein n=1 Tax=Amycolatopsis magusensis TaxID=882444 RepID=UPI0024A92B90|nr:SMI1/KNR4 family protein [Amycolatopsis magusensis]MDI5976201.1 SMI1/KNR4 family protein [Amycolatopsis magusensis]
MHEQLEPAVSAVLTAGGPQADRAVGDTALLLAGSGFPGEADRLVRTWLSATGRPVAALVSTPVHARAWAMLFEALGERPKWAGALVPLDLDAEEAAHRAHLSRPVPSLPTGLLGDSTAGRIVSGLAEHLEKGAEDPTKTALLRAEDLARDGDPEAAREALAEWAALRPSMPAALACRHLAPLLVAGADPLDLGEEHATALAAELIAALRTRHAPDTASLDWPALVGRILELREQTGRAPASTRDTAAAEARLGRELPPDYREFLHTSDGLPADVTFPRLLAAAELTAHGGVVPISEAGESMILLSPASSGWVVVQTDPVLGTSTHRTFRELLEEHLRLLES